MLKQNPVTSKKKIAENAGAHYTKKGIKYLIGVHSTTLRKIGNSCGILLTKEIINSLDICEGQVLEIIVEKNGCIVIKPAAENIHKKEKPNLDIKTWDAQFEKAGANRLDAKEKLFLNVSTKFDQEEWEW